ncbi:hypothetical protein [Methyloversatilis sp.]|uniref:hypothetical protein n=1 Tax=Methyloversatilis sp. TaxID=2569862 RepID=UPI0035B443FD
MHLEDVVRSDAALCELVEVEFDSSLPTVLIRDTTGFNDFIFLQGDEALTFEAQFEALQWQLPHVNYDVLLKHLAKPYVEGIWG